MTCNVAFIGLGVMGYPMAGYISKAGHNVTVFNRTGSKADKWVNEHKGNKADTPAKAAENADYILTCVGNDNDLREVTFGDNGIFKTIKKSAVYIDNTTASATIAREIYDHAKKNEFGFLDAPVSGGQAGAENGALTVMIGGDKKDFKLRNAGATGGAVQEIHANSDVLLQQTNFSMLSGRASELQKEKNYESGIQFKPIFNFGTHMHFYR